MGRRKGTDSDGRKPTSFQADGEDIDFIEEASGGLPDLRAEMLRLALKIGKEAAADQMRDRIDAAVKRAKRRKVKAKVAEAPAPAAEPTEHADAASAA